MDVWKPLSAGTPTRFEGSEYAPGVDRPQEAAAEAADDRVACGDDGKIVSM